MARTLRLADTRWVARHSKPLLTCCRRHRQAWHWVCALSLCTTYSLFLLFASLCTVTTLVHTDAHHNAPHQHADPDVQHSSTLPDACACVLQGLIPTALPLVSLLACVVPVGAILRHLVIDVPRFAPYTPARIRAPPSMHS